MKLSTLVITLATVIGYAYASHSNKLIRRKSTSGPVVLVTYNDGTQKFFNFEECLSIPKQNSSVKAVRLNFLQSTTCYIYSTVDCSGPSMLPVGIPYPAGSIVPNVDDFGELVTEAGKCYSIPLPGIPLLSPKNVIDSVA